MNINTDQIRLKRLTHGTIQTVGLQQGEPAIVQDLSVNPEKYKLYVGTNGTPNGNKEVGNIDSNIFIPEIEVMFNSLPTDSPINLHPNYYPQGITSYYTNGYLSIKSNFAKDAEFLKYNPRIELYRYVKRNTTIQQVNNRYVNSQKGYYHPRNNTYNTSNYRLIESVFPVLDYYMARTTNNEVTWELILPSKGTPFTVLEYVEMFGDVLVDSLKLLNISLNRRGRNKIIIKENEPNRSISVGIGFKLVTDVGESSMVYGTIKVSKMESPDKYLSFIYTPRNK